MKKRIFLFVLCIIFGATLGYVQSTKKEKRKVISEELWESLYHPKEMILYSLDPEKNLKPAEGSNLLLGYKVLKSKEIQSENEKAKIADAIKSAVSALFAKPAKCFIPRHALKITDEKYTYIFLICYECGNMEIFLDDSRIINLTIGGTPNLFNKILSTDK